MKFPIRAIVALALAVGFVAALGHDASAASKHKHHPAASTSKPSTQYLQAAPQK
jgi:hypothetical protein